MSEEIKESAKNLDLDVLNGGVPSDFYLSHPCYIGYTYVRFGVNGDVIPCCVARHEVSNINTENWSDIWHSGAYENFRQKLLKIHEDRFFLEDPEWTFCQQCSHLNSNFTYNKLVK